MMLYLISGRSFSSNSLTRKNYEVASCFQRVKETRVLCGADLYRHKVTRQPNSAASSASYYSKWYRRSPLMKGFAQSYAELKNIIHNIRLFHTILICDKKDNYSLVCERSSNLHWAGILFAKKKHIP